MTAFSVEKRAIPGRGAEGSLGNPAIHSRDAEHLTKQVFQEMEDKKKREMAKEQARQIQVKTKEMEKVMQEDSQRKVATQIVAILQAKGGRVTLNELMQDSASKKSLKPLLKEHGVKLSKSWLEKFPDCFRVVPEGPEVVILSI
mmetsp:Transcript_64398/g.208960  ORF Transcript_64398/g.208960 Transcript_64398/m.208960 type:complete len:144 (+) Transcript_64398:173-604(+)